MAELGYIRIQNSIPGNQVVNAHSRIEYEEDNSDLPVVHGYLAIISKLT